MRTATRTAKHCNNLKLTCSRKHGSRGKHCKQKHGGGNSNDPQYEIENCAAKLGANDFRLYLQNHRKRWLEK